MKQSPGFVTSLTKCFPAPEEPSGVWDDRQIEAFEAALGAELPSDYYEFLRVYGSGSFNDYLYVFNPFASEDEEPAELFLEETQQRQENYEFLERDNRDPHAGEPHFVDGAFPGGAFAVTGGSARLAEFLRVEKIDPHTRSKILSLGDHYPFPFYPEPGGLLFWGNTDDEEFFLRKNGDRFSVVLYSDGYYEFDMTVTEFLYEYLTGSLKLPMQNGENAEWEFIPY